MSDMMFMPPYGGLIDKAAYDRAVAEREHFSKRLREEFGVDDYRFRQTSYCVFEAEINGVWLEETFELAELVDVEAFIAKAKMPRIGQAS